VKRGQEAFPQHRKTDNTGKKGRKAAKAAGGAKAAAAAATEAERMKKVSSNCGKEGSGEKNFSSCGYCGITRYCSRDRQKAHWKVRY